MRPGTRAGPKTYPLSPLQQNMVVASLRDPAAGLYVPQLVCTLDENLQPTLLRAAFAQLVDHHPVLRSIIRLDGEPTQSIIESPAIEFVEKDLSHLDAPTREQAMRDLLAADRARGFDFAASPPHRLALIRMASAQYRLLWTCHHVLIDRHAWLLATKELFERYDSLRAGEPYSPVPTASFCEHIAWLARQPLEDAETFWRRGLAGFQAPLRLPIEARIDPAAPHPDPIARQLMSMPPGLGLALEALAGELDVTLNTLLQAAWALLLSRYCGSTDVVFGATRACRRSSIPGADTIVGPLLNTLPVRIAVEPNRRLGELIRDVRAQWIAMRVVEHTPLSQIHQWSDIGPGARLFETAVVFEGAELNAALRGGNTRWNNRGFEIIQRTDIPLTLFGHGKPALGLGIAFDRRRYDPADVARMLGHLRHLLEGFVRQASGRLGELPLLSDEERRLLLVTWNSTEYAYPREVCAQHFFEEQARAHPDQVALERDREVFRYGEANARANQIARILRQRGVGPERLVGVLLEPTPEVAIAMLAILKAGGAFVLLDPDSPAQRLAHIVADAAPCLVITRAGLESRIAGLRVPFLSVDTEATSIAQEARSDLAAVATATNLAYAVYTSGTTGKPKGTLVTHRSLVNHTLATRRVQQLCASDRRLQFVSLSSDVFVAEVFNYLSVGAALIFGLRASSASILDYLRFVDEHRITVAGMPASYWNEWVAALGEGEPFVPRALRLVISGMEKVQPAALEVWQRKIGGRVRWCNAYGPSETTCTAAIFEASPGDPPRGLVPIGKPLANTRIYVLDPELNPVPVGVPGELYIGGDGVARGYLNQPELTAEKFIADPFSDDPDARLYRTGDIGTWLADGNVAFIGRVDHQVKIRGHRIELGEIEETLSRHPAIQHCSVAVQESASGPWLCAYVVGKDSLRLPSDVELKRYLVEYLPTAMLPGVFVAMHELPRTQTGKVDRSRLPAPAPPGAPRSSSRRPRNRVELHLAKIWEDLLGVRSIGIDDGFFDLGGHSLLALRLVDRIEKHFGQRLPLDTLWFRASTIASLAELLTARHSGIESPALVPIKSGSRRPLFVTHTIGGHLFHYYELARALDADQPVIGLQARGVYDRNPPDASIARIAARCIRALRGTQARGPYALAGFSSGGLVAYEIAQQLAADGERVELLGLIDVFAPGTKIERRWLRRFLGPERPIARELQEKLYFSLLHPLSLDRWRKFSSVGEAHRWAHWSYRARPWHGSADLFLADESKQICREPALGWGRYVTGELRVHPIPHDHGMCVKPPAVLELARRLQARLDDVAAV